MSAFLADRTFLQKQLSQTCEFSALLLVSVLQVQMDEYRLQVYQQLNIRGLLGSSAVSSSPQ